MLLGAVIGDVAGSRFEARNYRHTDFEMFALESRITDDTVCTVAVAEWLRAGAGDDLPVIMRRWCQRYPDESYGSRFAAWLDDPHPAPYGSFGNGSAMRVSPVGWAFATLEETLCYAEKSAAITHNHPEGIKGAQAVAAAIFQARNGHDKTFIKENIASHFGYDLSASCDDIRPHFKHRPVCAYTVPPAIISFLESTDFEHAIRLAVSLGGDCDTVAAITGSIAEAFYGKIPDALVTGVMPHIPEKMRDILRHFGWQSDAHAS